MAAGTHNEKNQVLKKVKSIMQSIIPEKAKNIAELGPQDDLSATGMNSLAFINLVFEIETQFGFDFDDEKLVASEYRHLKDLVDYIESKCRS